MKTQKTLKLNQEEIELLYTACNTRCIVLAEKLKVKLGSDCFHNEKKDECWEYREWEEVGTLQNKIYKLEKEAQK